MDPIGGRHSGKTHWGPNVKTKSDGWCPAVKPISKDAETWGLPTWTLEGGLLLWEDTWLSPCETQNNSWRPTGLRYLGRAVPRSEYGGLESFFMSQLIRRSGAGTLTACHVWACLWRGLRHIDIYV